MNAMRLRRWVFTLNNPTDIEIERLKNYLTVSTCVYAIVAKEHGELDTLHLQGFVHFKEQLYFNTAKLRISCRANLESARGTDVQNKTYCEKQNCVIIEIGIPNTSYKPSETNNNLMYEIAQKMADGECLATICEDQQQCKVFARHHKAIEKLTHSIIQKTNRQLIFDNGVNIKWKLWQQKVIKIVLKEPDERTINWFYEEIGNTGKTFLTRYLLSAHPSCTRFENAKSADLKYAYNGEHIVLFDRSRSSEHIFNYEALESLKNGSMFSPKYESASKVYKIPHVVVFANWLPDMCRLSLDRWNIVKITLHDNLYTDHNWNDIVHAHLLLDVQQSDNSQHLVPQFHVSCGNGLGNCINLLVCIV